MKLRLFFCLICLKLSNQNEIVSYDKYKYDESFNYVEVLNLDQNKKPLFIDNMNTPMKIFHIVW